MMLSNHYGEYKYINLNWDSISGDVVEAGTPINADGEIANDNTAIGVMVDSCDRQWKRTAKLIVAGVLDELEAQTCSGMTFELNCKLALSVKITLLVNGVIDVSGSQAEYSIAVAG